MARGWTEVGARSIYWKGNLRLRGWNTHDTFNGLLDGGMAKFCVSARRISSGSLLLELALKLDLVGKSPPTCESLGGWEYTIEGW